MRKPIVFMYLFLTVLTVFSCDTRELPPPWELQPFYQAIANNDMETVQAYMKKYKHIANFEISNITGTTTIGTVMTAVMSGNMEMLDLMVKNRADFDHQIRPGGFTAIHVAIQMQRKDMIEYLLDHNADATIIDDLGNNVFHCIAHDYRNTEVFTLFQPYASELINQKNKTGYVPLILLIAEQYKDGYYEGPSVLELLQLYLDSGADVSLLFETTDIFDPFLYLVQYHRNEYLKLLLSYLDKKLPVFPDGLNYLHAAFTYGNHEIVPALIPLTEDINSVSYLGQTALHSAVRSAADYDTMQLLLENGADKTLKDNAGLTAYDLFITDNLEIDERIANLLRVE